MELALVVILVIVVLSVLPVWMAAKLVGAPHSGFFRACFATVLGALLEAVGTLVPVVGNIVAFLLVSWGFAMVFQTGFLKGIIIHAIQIVFWVVLAVIATLVFGVAVFGYFMAG